MRKKMVLGLFVLLLLMVTGVQGATTVTTATDNGADTYVTNDELSGPTVNHGSEEILEIRTNGTSRFRATVIRFDIRSVGGDKSGAILSLWQTSGPRARTMDVYGVTDGTLDSWDESTVCYNDAPGFAETDLGVSAMEPNAVTLLGTVSLPQTSGVEVTSSTTTLNFDDFIGLDTNGYITLIFIPTAAENYTWQFASRETTLGGVRVHPPKLTFPNARHATDPQPAIDEVVLPSLPRLSWTNPDPNSSGGIITSNVYIGTTEPNIVTDPNGTTTNYGLTKIATGITGTSVTIPFALSAPQTYYWIVDSYDSSCDTPFLGTGGLWAFEVTASPIILTQPTDQTEELTATFSITVSSGTTVTYTWYKSSDDASDTSDDDTQIGTNSATLTLTGLTGDDEGYYYCEVYNTYGQTYAVKSDPARLIVKRQVAYWTLDELVEGQYADSSGEGHNADPNGTPSFVTGAKGNGVTIDTANGWATAGTWNPSDVTGQITLSFWIKWNGNNGAGQGIMAKSDGFANSTMMWQLIIDTYNRIGLQRAGLNSIYSAASNMKTNEWDYVAVTCDGTTGTIYRVNSSNDYFVTNTGTFSFGTGTTANLLIGCTLSGGVSPLNGALDDIRIFNFVKDATALADLYNDVASKNFCTLTLGSEEFDLDYNNNCVVDMADFAVLAESWMQCGFYPECP